MAYVIAEMTIWAHRNCQPALLRQLCKKSVPSHYRHKAAVAVLPDSLTDAGQFGDVKTAHPAEQTSGRYLFKRDLVWDY
jgi:hypothetical protein